MSNTNGRVGGINTLTAMTTATKDIDAQIVWVDLNIGFFGLGQNRYGNGTSVDTTLTLGGWDTLDTVDT